MSVRSVVKHARAHSSSVDLEVILKSSEWEEEQPMPSFRDDVGGIFKDQGAALQAAFDRVFDANKSQPVPAVEDAIRQATAGIRKVDFRGTADQVCVEVRTVH